MRDLYVKQNLQDFDGITTFYAHYHNGYVVRQLEVNGNVRVKFTEDNPIVYSDNCSFRDRGLSNFPLEESDLDPDDFISEEEFEEEWNKES